MKLKNGFKLVYERIVEEKNKLFASKQSIPTVEDEAIDIGLTEEEIKAAKLIYEKDNSLVASEDLIPSDDDKPFSLTVDGEEVIGGNDEPGPEPTPVALIPFADGQTLVAGDKIKFDITADIDKFLNDLDYTQESGTLRILVGTVDSHDLLIATDLSAFAGKDCKVLMDDMDKSDFHIFYSTAEVTDPESGMTISHGWQQSIKDTDGKFNIEDTITLEEVATDVSGWNGKFVGIPVEE